MGVCSGANDVNVEFIISAVGDWTQDLARRCFEVRDKGARLPKIRLDGPWAAPTESAPLKKVIVAVGAGVGITPFLSLLSTIVGSLEADTDEKTHIKGAHFFWCARSADEFFFGSSHFARIVANSRARERIFLHLHCTGQATAGDAAAYLFREAVRRQSKVDLETFKASP